MAFAKGRAFVILNRMAEQGNPEAKKILKNLNSMSQEQLDGELSKLFGKSGGGEKAAAPKGKEVAGKGTKEPKVKDAPKDDDYSKKYEKSNKPVEETIKRAQDDLTELEEVIKGYPEGKAPQGYKDQYNTAKQFVDKQMKSAKEGIKPVETDYRDMPNKNELAGPEVTKQLAPLRDKYKNDKGMSRFIDNIEETHAELLERKPKATLAATIDSYLNYNVKSGWNSMAHQDTLKIAQDLGIDTKGHAERFKQVADDEAPFVELRDRLREEGNDVDEGYIMDIMDGYDKDKYNSVDEYLAEYTPKNGRESDAYDEIMATVTGAEKFEKQNPIKEPKGQMKSAKEGIKPVEDKTVNNKKPKNDAMKRLSEGLIRDAIPKNDTEVMKLLSQYEKYKKSGMDSEEALDKVERNYLKSQGIKQEPIKKQEEKRTIPKYGYEYVENINKDLVKENKDFKNLGKILSQLLFASSDYSNIKKYLEKNEKSMIDFYTKQNPNKLSGPWFKRDEFIKAFNLLKKKLKD